MTTTARPLGVSDRTASARLPERLRTSGLLLFTSDCVSAVFALVAVLLISGSGAAPFITLTVTLLIASGAGRYRTSFALQPRDEWYFTIGVAILGTMAGALLTAIIGFNWAEAVATSVVWAVFAGLAAEHLNRVRRAGTTYEGALDHVREGPRTSLWYAQQSIIRLLDVIFATAGLIVFSPVMAVIALAIWRDGGRPVLFRQNRVRRDDRVFEMWKFRTMRVGAGNDWAHPGDSRITSVGSFLRRTSLDELPQLWNVIRGDMSLVGPRPEMQEYADDFSRRFINYSQRHIIPPGVTGWTQLVLPRNFQPDDEADVLRYDLFYVQYVSVYLYMHCLVKTACEVFSHRAV